jgi:DNA primase
MKLRQDSKFQQLYQNRLLLKKRGKEYVGLSPFKNEKTPSFTVNDEKEFYHCFATSEHGNIFDFVMKTQNFKVWRSSKTLSTVSRNATLYVFKTRRRKRKKMERIFINL